LYAYEGEVHVLVTFRQCPPTLAPSDPSQSRNARSRKVRNNRFTHRLLTTKSPYRQVICTGYDLKTSAWVLGIFRRNHPNFLVVHDDQVVEPVAGYITHRHL